MTLYRGRFYFSNLDYTYVVCFLNDTDFKGYKIKALIAIIESLLLGVLSSLTLSQVVKI